MSVWEIPGGDTSKSVAQPKAPPKMPTLVDIVIAGKMQTITWQQFTELANCCHELESSYYAHTVVLGDVTVRTRN